MSNLLFCATMQPHIPLRVLLRHGETHTDPGRPPPQIAQAEHEGIWVRLLHGQKTLFGTMASAVGAISADGGNFLQFLIAIREIVEQDSPVGDRVRELKAALKLLEWRGFSRKLKSPRHGDLVDQFFPLAVDTIPGLPPSARESLTTVKLKTAAKIAATSDAELLKLKGIGPAKITAIRQWQESVKDKEAVRLDMVER